MTDEPVTCIVPTKAGTPCGKAAAFRAVSFGGHVRWNTCGAHLASAVLNVRNEGDGPVTVWTLITPQNRNTDQ
jgi:hypothetical protein